MYAKAQSSSQIIKLVTVVSSKPDVVETFDWTSESERNAAGSKRTLCAIPTRHCRRLPRRNVNAYNVKISSVSRNMDISKSLSVIE